MDNIHNFTRTRGAVLISALLFLLVLTLLAINIVQIGVLETKMSKNYQDKIFATQQAEHNLIALEKKIASSKVLPAGVSEISTAICGVTFYRVQATGEYHATKTTLQSTYAIIDDASSCDPKPSIQPGRQSWRQLL